MKKIWSVILVVTVLAGAALVTRRVIWAGKRPSSLANDKADVRSSGSATSPVRAPAVDSPAVEISQRGPGMRRKPPEALKLPVPRTFDLAHVQAASFAAALGKDPARIFNFVRDEISYEVYTGCLRGPRGTLLAMAGNSVDRASLLAGMLQSAGQQVRFVHGTLPEAQARELIASMWAERPHSTVQVAAQTDPSSTVKAAVDSLFTAVNRDYSLIRDQLKKANVPISRESAPSLDSLVKEAQDHYWVQWLKGGTWVDLDPSFSDSSQGTKYAPIAGTSDSVPDALFHQVELRIRLEEYTGDRISNRVILTRRFKAADLSGVDVLISHQPENWHGPAASLPAALAAGIQATGRIKPVLVIGNKDWVAGEAFYPKSPPTSGMGGIFNALSGIGTRNQAPIATAESLEFDFITPSGSKETVVREISDVVGKARRAKGQKLSADELRSQTEAKSVFDITQGVYDVFFTTGRIEAAHLAGVVGKRSSKGDSQSVRAGLRLMSIAFTAASDLLLPRIGRPERAVILFYPDSPRVQIAEMASVQGSPRLSLDLRRDHTRALAMGVHPEDIFLARVFRGVIDGTLERCLVEVVTGAAHGEGGWGPIISTSSIFERAQAGNVPILTLAVNQATIAEGASEDARARIREDLSNGYVVLTPKRAINFDGKSQLAWWRVDARSGEVLGITEQGLHQTTVEYIVWKDEDTYEVDVFVNGRYGYSQTIESGFEDLANYIQYLQRVRGAIPIDPVTALSHVMFPG